MPAKSALAEHRPAKATYQDVLDAPPHMVAEILEGRLCMNARPAMKHSGATTRLLSLLAPIYETGIGTTGGWWFHMEPEVHLKEHVLVPDIAAWSVQTSPAPLTDPWSSIPPDWVCETLSPSTRQMDRTGKRDVYARHSVKHLWFVDPDQRSLEAFTLRDGRFHEVGARRGEERVALPPFEAAAFPLDDLWPRRRA